MLVGRFLLWQFLARQAFRLLLRRDPDGELPLAILEVLLFGQLADPAGSRRRPRLFGCLRWHHRIRSLVAELGLSLRPRHPVTERRWYHDGGLHGDGPTGIAERAAHERAIARLESVRAQAIVER